MRRAERVERAAPARRSSSACGQAVGERARVRRVAQRRHAGRGSRCSRPRCCAAPERGSASSSPSVYGCCGCANSSSGRRLLDGAAGVHDQDPVGDVGDDAEVVGDEQDRGAEPLAEVAQQVEDPRLDRHVERGGRLVGDQQLRVAGDRHRDHHALAHAAGELVRVLVEPPRRRRDADQLAAARSPGRAPPRRRQPEVVAQHLADLAPDGEHRVQRGHRLLEHERDLAPAHARAGSRSSSREQVAARRSAPCRRHARGGGSSRSSAIAVTLLPQPDSPTTAEHLAAVERERDAVDGEHRALLGAEARPTSSSTSSSGSSARHPAGRGRRAARRRAG